MVGAVAGCALAEALLRLFVAIAPAGIPFLGKAHLDLRIIFFTGIVSIVCGIFSGLAPALQKPTAQMLTGQSLTISSRAAMRQWLVVGQIAAGMVLLIGAMLLLRSFSNLRNQQLGMRDDSTLTVSITLGEHGYPTAEQLMTFFQQLARQLQCGPGVSLVAASDSLPPAASHNDLRYDSIVVSGEPPSTGGSGGLVTYRLVSPDYFRALDIPILQGKCFSEEQLISSDRFVVLSQQLATRLFPGRSPLGEHLDSMNGTGRLLGTRSLESQPM